MAECSIPGCGSRMKCRQMCDAHYKRWRRTGDPAPSQPIQIRGDVEGRFWSKVDKSGDCWIWRGSRASLGYGQFPIGKRMTLAHRIAYTFIRGSIPDGLVLDHLCQNTSCVNPDHLDPVTHRENILRGSSPHAINARKTSCPSGHPYSAENTYIPASGGRKCRTCHRLRQRERQRLYRCSAA